MMIKKVKKVLSFVVIATYLIASAPMGLCVNNISQKINGNINKPALRTTAKPSSLKLEGDISITKGNPKISLSLRDSDVQQALRMFADKAGLNIIFHNSVEGTVTMDLVNVPLNEAFKMILQVAGLTYYIDNNTMIVASAEASRSLNLSKQELMTIPIKYADAGNLAVFLNQNIFSINKPGLSNAQIAVTNPSANEILIFGTKNDFIMAKKVIEQFDKKPLEEIFIVNHTTPKEMADLLCKVLFKDSEDAGGSAEIEASKVNYSTPSGKTEDTNSSNTPSQIQQLLPTPTLPTGNPTGGAASTDDDSLTLGEGVISCQYKSDVKADSLSSLKGSSLVITYFTQRGAIGVEGGSLQQMQMIKDFIEKNDKKQSQAYLELSIIELSESGMREFDNTWQVWSKFFSGTFDGTATKTNPLYPNFIQGDAYSVMDSTDPTQVLYTISKYTGTPIITYAINYIIQNNKGRVLANPRIMITNGQKSTIDLSSDYVKTVTSQLLTTSLTGGVQRTYEIGNDEGIKIEMTPFISLDGYVTLNINPNYSTVKEKVYSPSITGTGTDLAATLLQRRNLELKNVRIKDGETLVIGGMIRENETKTVSKIPVLGDIPGLGFMFRNSATTKEKQELVIMITPKIIKDSEEVVNNSNVTL